MWKYLFDLRVIKQRSLWLYFPCLDKYTTFLPLATIFLRCSRMPYNAGSIFSPSAISAINSFCDLGAWMHHIWVHLFVWPGYWAALFRVPNLAICDNPNSFGTHISPTKCQMQSRHQKLRLPNYMQLRRRGRGMRLVKQKCQAKVGQDPGRNCHIARRIKAKLLRCKVTQKHSPQQSKFNGTTWDIQHQTLHSTKHCLENTRQSFGFTLVVASDFAAPVVVNFRGGSTCSAWLFSGLSSSCARSCSC